MKRSKFSSILITCVLFFGLFLPACGVYAKDSVVVNPESGAEYRTGLELFNNKNYSEAVLHFQKAYELDSRNLNAQFAHGLTLGKLGKYKEAAVLFQLVLDNDSEHEKALKMLPNVLVKSGDTDKALDFYDRYINAQPDNYEFYLGKAVIYLQQKNYEESIPLLLKVHEKTPDNIEIYEKLMFAYSAIGNSEESYKIAQTILKKDENHARARVISADYKRQKQNYEASLKDYEIAVKNIETKAYAEHYIEVIHQKLEEIEIEKEYQERQQSN